MVEGENGARRFAYARVSSAGQSLEGQIERLRKEGCDLIFEEKKSGVSRNGREELRRMLAVLRPGDQVVVTRLDRLGRSILDLAAIAEEIKQAGASLRVIEQAVDTSTSAGRAFFGMLSTFAQFENDIRRERQMEGIARAKAAGRYRGRKRQIDSDKVRQLREAGHRPAEIAKQMGITRQSVYNALRRVDAD
jgi:DNA invertase Pin-like site-specific DNA recombinase